LKVLDIEQEAVVSLFHWLKHTKCQVYAIDVSEKALPAKKCGNKPSGCYLYEQNILETADLNNLTSLFLILLMFGI
jgi:hypothetical protein